MLKTTDTVAPSLQFPLDVKTNLCAVFGPQSERSRWY